MTRDEQLQMDRDCDNKHNLQLLCRTLRPGDPDFDKVAAQVTPTELIRAGVSTDKTVFYAEADPVKKYRRNETHSTLRG